MHLWVKVETDAGVTGVGECVHGGVQAIAILKQLAPKIDGARPVCHRRHLRGFSPQLCLRRRHAGALITALTGLEIALWDLKGKALNMPVYELMGGKFRDKVRVYADCQVEPGMDFPRNPEGS